MYVLVRVYVLVSEKNKSCAEHLQGLLSLHFIGEIHSLRALFANICPSHSWLHASKFRLTSDGSPSGFRCLRQIATGDDGERRVQHHP